ncbi:hypothetical protein N0B31_19685 [Salinirubellus salinus]|uniref:Uncharacterized protein n=1 Tax=Salinirubellus salinus TaxID=1364945 RepID=A0A9E7R2E3_9EURY|nr:hypothetical protein [Salinirubellus salinus]UWM54326.1 hypothetical protein N0B31_19685 [Salinirubellus salinus]
MEETSARRQHAVEFTYEWYEGFLNRLRSSGYEFGSIATPPTEGEVILRHDVDLSPSAALRMGCVEADHDVRSAYFFLLGSPLYNPLNEACREVIGELESLGHAVGLHFSTHQYWSGATRPGDEAVAERVREEQSVLATLAEAPLSPVSFHVPPDWVLGESFDGLTSTYEPAYFETPTYAADSGQRWRSAPPLADGDTAAAQVLVHPGLWGETDASFRSRVESAVTEACVSLGQWAVDQYLEEGDG